MHDQITNRRHISYDPFTEEQQQILRNKIMQYVNSEIEELEVCFFQFPLDSHVDC